MYTYMHAYETCIYICAHAKEIDEPGSEVDVSRSKTQPRAAVDAAD